MGLSNANGDHRNLRGLWKAPPSTRLLSIKIPLYRNKVYKGCNRSNYFDVTLKKVWAKHKEPNNEEVKPKFAFFLYSTSTQHLRRCDFRLQTPMERNFILGGVYTFRSYL